MGRVRFPELEELEHFGARGTISGRPFDPEKAGLNYYTYECREYQRYCKSGWETGAPADNIEAHDLWNNTHTATLEDYKLKGTVEDLYHPDAPLW